MKTTALIAACLFLTVGTLVPVASADVSAAPACVKPVRFISSDAEYVPTGTHAHSDGVWVHATLYVVELWWENTVAGATPCYITRAYHGIDYMRVPFTMPVEITSG